MTDTIYDKKLLLAISVTSNKPLDWFVPTWVEKVLKDYHLSPPFCEVQTVTPEHIAIASVEPHTCVVAQGGKLAEVEKKLDALAESVEGLRKGIDYVLGLFTASTFLRGILGLVPTPPEDKAKP